jgi:hypothetical protein
MNPSTSGAIRAPLCNDDYKLPFHFSGTIDKPTFKLGPSQLLPTDKKAAEDAAKSADN